jgi:hypothetical protein
MDTVAQIKTRLGSAVAKASPSRVYNFFPLSQLRLNPFCGYKLKNLCHKNNTHSLKIFTFEKKSAMIGKIFSSIGEGFAARRLRKDQQKALNNLKESNFIAPSLLQAEQLAQKNVNATRYAGQDQDEANIRQGAATAYDNVARATTSGSNLVNAALGIQTNQNKAMQNVAQTGQRIRQGNQAGWTNLLLQKAGAQTYNRRQYEGSKSALQGAIMQNRARQKNAFWNAGAALLDTAEEGAKAFVTGGASLMGGGSGGGQANWLQSYLQNNKWSEGR